MSKEPETQIVARPGPDQKRIEDQESAPVRGKWYWVSEKNADGKTTKWFGCVTHVGSNYVKLKGPISETSMHSDRIHFDEFWQRCTYVPEPDPIINGKIEKYRQLTADLMDEVKALTAKLGVAPRQEIEDGSSADVKAISVRSSEPVEAYKKALVKAEKKTLPDLFQKIQDSNSSMATWMKAKVIPLEAEAKALKKTLVLVKDRIFSVELYAGLVETATKVRDGVPAGVDEQVHLMQRRAYMDEECLVGYEHGGMEYEDIADFEKWLCKPKNFLRLFPYPKTFLAFRVRRHDKERERPNTLAGFIEVMSKEQADKTTYLYVRNGEQLFRIKTEIEFDEQLFPDPEDMLFTSKQLWAHIFCDSVKDIITDEQYQGKIEEFDREEALLKKKYKEGERWLHRHHDNPRERYIPFSPTNVHYDDIMAKIEAAKKHHNRLVLVMQGLLDRSPVLHPHPPWQLWTPEGFAAAFKLIYDGTRALSAGDKPDFEAYRARLNSHLVSGSITVGQEIAWEIREAERVNRERERDHHRHHSDFRYKRYRPDRDPGPGKLAIVSHYDEKRRACTYTWKRKTKKYPYEKDVPESLTTGEENVLNVDAYKPGDFLIFFEDPRTRMEYLQWAPMLLEAEECHAGNRKLKPARSLPPVQRVEKKIGGDEDARRPIDLDFKEPKEHVPIADRYVGKKVTFNFSTQTKGGTKFKKGEVATIIDYSRQMVNLETPDKRVIFGVRINHVTIVTEEDRS